MRMIRQPSASNNRITVLLFIAAMVSAWRQNGNAGPDGVFPVYPILPGQHYNPTCTAKVSGVRINVAIKNAIATAVQNQLNQPATALTSRRRPRVWL